MEMREKEIFLREKSFITDNVRSGNSKVSPCLPLNHNSSTSITHDMVFLSSLLSPRAATGVTDGF
jgi:hypothetical protein